MPLIDQGLPPKSQIADRWVVETALGSCACGITYIGMDLLTRQAVTIEEYFPFHFARRAGSGMVMPSTVDVSHVLDHGRSRYIEEGLRLKFVRHPNIAFLIDQVEDRSTAYRVYSHYSGTTLSKWQEPLRRRDHEVESASWFVLILEALESLHACDTVHGNLEADNVIFTSDGEWIVLAPAGRASRTEYGVGLTAGYSSAEHQLLNRDLIGPWTDIYSVAALLHLVITGQLPPDVQERLIDDSYTLLGEHPRPNYRMELLKAVDWGLKLRPKDRPQSIADWRAAFLVGTTA